MNTPALKSLIRKSVSVFSNNPGSYVFMASFAVACTLLQYVRGDLFFSRNLADLTPLNGMMPYLLLLFTAALSMNSWSDEKKFGTEEYLMTLPVSTRTVVAGKFLGLQCNLLLSLSMVLPSVAALYFIGDPDSSLIFASLLACLLCSTAMLAVGFFCSCLSDNPTVAFIIACSLNGLFTFSHIIKSFCASIGLSIPMDIPSLSSVYSECCRGILSPRSLLLCLGLSAIFLYLSQLVLTRRIWDNGRQGHLIPHLIVRSLCCLTVLFSLSQLSSKVSYIDLGKDELHAPSKSRAIFVEDAQQLTIYVLLATLLIPALIGTSAFIRRRRRENITVPKKRLKPEVSA